MKRLISALIVMTLLITLLSGCGGGTKEVELEVFSTKGENKQVLEALATKFSSDREGVTVIVNAPADASTVIKTRLAKNDMPDIFAIGGDNNYKEIQSAGILADLSEESYITDIQESYLKMVYELNKDHEEVPYAIPYATNASGILYNVDKFNALGLEIPKTWDELQQAVDTIEGAGGTPFLLTFKDTWTTLPIWNSLVPSIIDDSFFDARLAGNTSFLDTHSEILEKFLFIMEHAQEDFMGTSYDDGNKAFANGEGYMMVNGNWAINQFINANPDFKVDAFAFPAVNDSSKNYVISGVDVLFTLSKDSENLDLAKEFVTFMVKQESAKTYIDDQFAFSAVKGVAQEDAKVQGLKDDIGAGNVANFPDHYYPSGFDLASVLSQYALNYTEGMDSTTNIETILKTLDENYDVANVE